MDLRWCGSFNIIPLHQNPSLIALTSNAISAVNHNNDVGSPEQIELQQIGSSLGQTGNKEGCYNVSLNNTAQSIEIRRLFSGIKKMN